MTLTEYKRELYKCGLVCDEDEQRISVLTYRNALELLEEAKQKLSVNDNTALIEVLNAFKKTLCLEVTVSQAKIVARLMLDARSSVPYGIDRYVDVRG